MKQQRGAVQLDFLTILIYIAPQNGGSAAGIL